MFANRSDAGRQLADRVSHLRDDDVVVVGLPRGGVPVAAEVAAALDVPLDVIVVRKLGVPSQPELAMGAIGEEGVRVVNEDVVRAAGVGRHEIDAVEAREREALEQRARRLRTGHDRIPLARRVAVIVDDGIATGSTARAACQVAREEGASRVVLATPVAPGDAPARLADVADDFVCVEQPTPFHAVGQFYQNFGQTTDDEVIELLAAAPRSPISTDPPSGGAGEAAEGAEPPREMPAELEVVVGQAQRPGLLAVPDGAAGLVIFAHGSGSSRHSPRNRFVASVLHGAGLATLLFDLLTDDEAADRRNVFDVGLLAERLVDATRWATQHDALRGLGIGYFGASTGAAAALAAASSLGQQVGAVVSRGGRPDLAGDALSAVRSPTLLIVGGDDRAVVEMNEDAQRQLHCDNRLDIVPQATHLFEEPGALETVAEHAREWFTAHLGSV